jgi:1,3-beta-glucanosyltransferase GAS1
MDKFVQFDNVLGFFIGNEIIAINNQSTAAPFIKAATRDMKAYRDKKGYRKIPIGYSAADIAELRPMLQDYLTCGGNSSENIDFFGLNSYSWCDPSTYQTSGYINLQSMSDQFPVPIFFSETGCIEPGPRTWDDQDAIFSQPMIDDWSGAIVYEWIMEENKYGIISYGPPTAKTITDNNVYDGFTRKGTPTPRSPDFNNLKSKWAAITPTGVAKSAYNPDSVSTRACPKSTVSGWLVDGNVKLPSMGETYKGSFTSSPSATMPPTKSGSAASTSTSSQGGASGNKQILGMSAGLVGVMLFFTFWA